ncbi:MAG: twin-arginine translocase TatA/TatE family subunit [Bryobacteraceae bacterium]|jgi:sec-independent protein translocase protein TatA
MQPVLTAGLSVEHLLLFAAIFVVLFGGKKVGEFGKGLGEGIRNFKSALKGDEEKKEEAAVEVKK